jgi:branched-chain amino acid transport system substrate-binding protein
MLQRRTLLATAAAGFLPATPAVLKAAETPGVTATEIRLGNTCPYSGPVSAYGTVARTMAAAFRMANEQGGFAGRKVTFLSYDDAYSPPKTVEQVRRLIEEDNVAALFGNLGSPTNAAIAKYVNQKKVPHLFLTNGLDRWGDYQDYPWTIGWQPSVIAEARAYARYLLAEKPDAKIGILHQNDDFGKDYIRGMRDILQDRYDKQVT